MPCQEGLLIYGSFSNPQKSIVIQKRHPYTGNLNSGTSGASKNVFLHCGDVLGEGSWLRLWQLDSQLVSQGQTNMAPAKYKGLGFPDIVQLAFPDTACQLIAGCSSTGLLAVWSIR